MRFWHRAPIGPGDASAEPIASLAVVVSSFAIFLSRQRQGQIAIGINKAPFRFFLLFLLSLVSPRVAAKKRRRVVFEISQRFERAALFICRCLLQAESGRHR